MQRDYSVFPKDANGDVLWLASQRGVNMGEEYTVRYALIFPDANNALKFGLFLLRQGYWVQVNELVDKPGYAAEVLLKMGLDISHQDITSAEDWLAKQAASLHGENDGWEIQEKIEDAVISEFSEPPGN